MPTILCYAVLQISTNFNHELIIYPLTIYNWWLSQFKMIQKSIGAIANSWEKYN